MAGVGSGYLCGASRDGLRRQCQCRAEAGEHDEGNEGGPEALVEHDERVRPRVRREVVMGTGDGNRGGDRDADCRADPERGVAQTGGESGLVLGDAGERRDGRTHEGEADPGTEHEQPEEDVAEVAAVYRDLGENQRSRTHEPHARRGDRPDADPQDRALGSHSAARRPNREHHRADPERDGRIAEHLLRVE